MQHAQLCCQLGCLLPTCSSPGIQSSFANSPNLSIASRAAQRAALFPLHQATERTEGGNRPVPLSHAETDLEHPSVPRHPGMRPRGLISG